MSVADWLTLLDGKQSGMMSTSISDDVYMQKGAPAGNPVS